MHSILFAYLLVSWRPAVFLFAILLAISYAVVTGPMGKNLIASSSYKKPTHSEYAAFTSLLLVFIIATGTPLDLSAQTQSFVAYIIQMLLMTMVMPWLLLLSVPQWLTDALLSLHGVHQWTSRSTNPIVASFTYNLIATLSLLPFILDLNLASNWIHIVIQTSIMISAVFFWWPFANKSKTLSRITGLREFFYIAYSIVFMLPIVIVLLLVRSPWYDAFQSAGISVATKITIQQDGAKLMLIGMLFVFGTLGIRVLRHLDRSFWYNTPS